MTFDPLLGASPVIQVHAALALLAMLIGAAQLFRKKGDASHRALGRLWVAAMALVALSSLFIWQLRMIGLFSPIHLISLFVLVMLWRGISFARRGDIAHHRRTMQNTYVIGLIVTGLFTFVPGRIMYRVAFGPAGATPEKLAIFGAVAVLLAAAAALVIRWRRSLPSAGTNP